MILPALPLPPSVAGNGGRKTPLTIQSLFPSLLPCLLHANSYIAAINVTMADAKKGRLRMKAGRVHGQMKHFVGPERQNQRDDIPDSHVGSRHNPGQECYAE